MNFLFFMADEFRFDAAGCLGNPVVRTPNLDRLAQGAAVFQRAYTASPVCVPSRQCLATGRYPLHIGCERFGEDIAPGSMTFARQFSEAGYYTVACGKLHHRGPDQMQGWTHRIGSETAVRWPEAFAERSQIGRRRWQGADDVRRAGVGRSPLAVHDDYTVQGACDFLGMHFSGDYAIPVDTPLLLMVSLQQPHFPLLTEPDLFDYYQSRVPVYWDQPAAGHAGLDRGRLGPENGVGRADAQRATAAYYGMVEQTDRRIGQILRALREAGQDLEQWTIVFTSDHGDMLGEHGVWEKRSFYEGSARVPLMIRGPGVPAGPQERLASLVDLFPTLCGLAGVTTPPDLDGHDLFGGAPAERIYVQYESDHFLVREGALKYLSFADRGSEVLFDLERDPGETRDVSRVPEYHSDVERLRMEAARFAATRVGENPGCSA